MRMWHSIESSLKRAGLFRREGKAFDEYCKRAGKLTERSPKVEQEQLVTDILDLMDCPVEFRKMVD